MSSDAKPSDLFADRLKAARLLRGWTQADLAARAGLPPTSIAHFEAGSRKPSFDNLRRLATALEVTTDYLLGRSDDPSVSQSDDPPYRHASQLTGADRKLAADFLEILAARSTDGHIDLVLPNGATTHARHAPASSPPTSTSAKRTTSAPG